MLEIKTQALSSKMQCVSIGEVFNEVINSQYKLTSHICLGKKYSDAEHNMVVTRSKLNLS